MSAWAESMPQKWRGIFENTLLSFHKNSLAMLYAGCSYQQQHASFIAGHSAFAYAPNSS